MTITNAVLVEAKYAESSDTTQYTSTGLKTVITKFTATNNDSSTRTISVNLVPSGGSVSGSNVITKTKSLQPGENYTFPELVNQTLEAGDFISTIASASSAINIRVSGNKITS